MAIELDRTAQVWGITGNLGGGKTLSAVHFAVNAMRDFFFVCSNVTIDIDLVCAHYGEHLRKLYQHIDVDSPDFDPFKIPCGSPRGSGGRKRVLVILDECAEYFDQYSNARDFKVKKFWSWLRHSSKRSQDVFIIVQRPDYLNKVIRILVSRWMLVDDLAVWRLPVLKFRLPFMKNYVVRNVYDRQGNRISAASFISKSFWGQFYNTAECLNKEGADYAYEYDVPKPTSNFHYWLLLFLLAAQSLVFRSLFVPRFVPPPSNQLSENRFLASPCGQSVNGFSLARLIRG